MVVATRDEDLKFDKLFLEADGRRSFRILRIAYFYQLLLVFSFAEYLDKAKHRLQKYLNGTLQYIERVK